MNNPLNFRNDRVPAGGGRFFHDAEIIDQHHPRYPRNVEHGCDRLAIIGVAGLIKPRGFVGGE